jgi:hypothetical protein
MAKRIPKIIVTHTQSPRYASLPETWQIVGPVLARILAAAMGRDKESKNTK